MEKLDKANIEDIVYLSPQQEGLLFHYLKEDGTAPYFIQLSFTLDGQLDREILTQAIQHVVQTNESLRSVFRWDGLKRPVQIILRSHVADIEYHDLSSVATDRRDAAMQEFLDQDRSGYFDLRSDSFKYLLLKLSTDKHLLIIRCHHINVDGWSTALLMKEIVHSYEQLRSGVSLLTTNKRSLRNFRTTENKPRELFWKNYLKGAEIHEFQPSPETNSHSDKIGRVVRKIDAFDKKALEKYCGTLKITPAAYLYTSIGLLLSRYKNIEDVVMGTTVSTRGNFNGADDVIGYFINTLPIRIQANNNRKIKDLLVDVNRDLIERSEAEQDSEIDIKRSLGSNLADSLYDTVIVVENYPVDESIADHSKDLHISLGNANEHTHYPLCITVYMRSTIEVELTYQREFFGDALMDQFSSHVENILKETFRHADKNIDELEILGDLERKELLPTAVPVVDPQYKGKTLGQLFSEVAKKFPARRALKFNDQELSYNELDEQSRNVAVQLIANGVIPGGIVGVMIPKSIDFMVSILGILRAGACYMPIDPDYPDDRRNYMVADSGCEHLIIDDETIVSDNAFCKVLTFGKLNQKPDHDPLTDFFQGDDTPAYIIYTSGTTGKPKGCVIEHKTVVNLLFANSLFDFTPDDVWCMFHSPSFDVSVWEMFMALLNGGTLVVIPKLVAKDPALLMELIGNDSVTVLNQTPSAFSNLMAAGFSERNEFSKLRYVILAGEALNPVTLRTLATTHPDLKLINMYGPTETTVYVTYKHITSRDMESSASNIGKALPHCSLYILGKDLRLLPKGVAGELYIGGFGVSRGYLNRQELTNSKFVKSPFNKDEVLYRTGDLARWLPNDDVQYIGRLDRQVKVRGFRVELGEIEQHLSYCPGVNDAYVNLKQDKQGSNYLCAYYISENPIDESVIWNFLNERIPDYMIPTRYVHLRSFPLNTNGKMDVRALPEPSAQRMGNDNIVLTDTEKILISVYEQILGLQGINIDDNFFSIGGDSIKSIQIASRLHALGLSASVKNIISYPTIRTLAQKVDCVTIVDRGDKQNNVSKEFDLTPIQQWFFDNTDEKYRHHFNQAVMLTFPRGVDTDVINQALVDVVRNHEALHTKYVVTNGKVVAKILSADDHQLEIIEHDFSDPEVVNDQIVHESRKIQGSMDLERGAVIKVGVFQLACETKVLIAIHHLAIDGVSWRILLEDLEMFFSDSLEKDQSYRSNTFEYWSGALKSYVNNDSITEAIRYWSNRDLDQGRHIPKDFNDADNKTKDIGKHAFVLDSKISTSLIGSANRAYQTRINDLLLAGLAIAINKAFGITTTTIDVEGHGREEVMDNVDITRTIGWFTSMFPVCLSATDPTNPANVISEVKETLRSIPNNGFDYGVLRYLASDKHPAIAKKLSDFGNRRVSFNYLGQFDNSTKGKLFTVDQNLVGESVHGELTRSHELEFVAMMNDNKLRVELWYGKHQFNTGTIERLMFEYERALLSVHEACERMTKNIFAHVSGNVEDLYPLTAVQKGILIETLRKPNEALYIQQLTFDLETPHRLQDSIVTKSLEWLIQRHELLRGSVLHQGLPQPVLVIQDRAEICASFIDLASDTLEEKQIIVEETVDTDRTTAFNLAKGPLLRVTAIRTNENVIKFVWTFHHILVDGWSIGVLSKEFLLACESLVKQDLLPVLPSPRSYSSYLSFVQKNDTSKAKNFWRGALDQYPEVVFLPQSHTNNDSKVVYAYHTLNQSLATKVRKQAQAYNATVNTFLQTVWGIFVAKLNNTRDVVFGTVVSGRYPNLGRMEEMVGLFMNTVPMRVRFDETTRMSELVRDMQTLSLDIEQYQYIPLVDILSGHDELLINNLIVFESFDLQTDRISNASSYVQTNYDLYLAVSYNESITFTFKYNQRYYPHELIAKWIKKLEGLLTKLVDDDPIVDQLTLKDKKEQGILVKEFLERI